MHDVPAAKQGSSLKAAAAPAVAPAPSRTPAALPAPAPAPAPQPVPPEAPVAKKAGARMPADVKRKLRMILDIVDKSDKRNIFKTAVSAKQVPHYYNIVKEPMYFKLVKSRLEQGEYSDASGFQRVRCACVLRGALSHMNFLRIACASIGRPACQLGADTHEAKATCSCTYLLKQNACTCVRACVCARRTWTWSSLTAGFSTAVLNTARWAGMARK